MDPVVTYQRPCRRIASFCQPCPIARALLLEQAAFVGGSRLGTRESGRGNVDDGDGTTQARPLDPGPMEGCSSSSRIVDQHYEKILRDMADNYISSGGDQSPEARTVGRAAGCLPLYTVCVFSKPTGSGSQGPVEMVCSRDIPPLTRCETFAQGGCGPSFTVWLEVV